MLGDHNFRTIWSAVSLVELSRRLELLVLSWFVLTRTDSLFELGLVLVFLNLPRPFFSLFTGMIADRFNRRYILISAQGLNTSVAAALLFLFVADLVQPWHVYVAVFLQGTSRAFEDPSRRTVVFDIVGPSRIVQAFSLESLSNTTGKLVGPVMGGVLLGLVGFNGAYTVAIMVHTVAWVLFFLIKVPTDRRTDAVPLEPVWSSLGSAIRYAFHNPVFLGLLYITVLMNALVFPVQQFIPAIGRDDLGVGPALVGLLVAAESFGQLPATLFMASIGTYRNHGRIFLLGSLGILVTVLLFVWSPWYGLSFFLLTLTGVGQACFGIMQSSITMLSSPREMRGRMMGLLGICIGGGTPVGALGISAAAAVYGIQLAILVNILAGLLLFLPVLVSTPLAWEKLRQQLPTQSVR